MIARINLTVMDASELDDAVELVDVVVGGGGDRQRVATTVRFDPPCGDRGGVLFEASSHDAVMADIGVERRGVTATELEAGGGFPVVSEPVDAIQLAHRCGAAELIEPTTSTDGL